MLSDPVLPARWGHWRQMGLWVCLELRDGVSRHWGPGMVPAPGVIPHPHGSLQSTAQEHQAIVCEGAGGHGAGGGAPGGGELPVLWRPSPHLLPLGWELSPSADLDGGVGAEALPCGGILPLGRLVPLPPQAGTWAGRCASGTLEPTALSSCPKEPGAQRESCGLGWTSGPERGTRVGGQSGELDFRGPEGAELAGGGPQGGGTHFSEGDILPFTTLKRLCSNFSPQ